MPLHEEPLHSLHVSSPLLSTLNLPAKYLQRLQRAGFTTPSEIILLTPDNLKSQTGLTTEEVQDVYGRLSELCSPKVATISEHLSEDSHGFITLGSADLDRVFGTVQAGISTGLLTEIAGESACGKTCLSLQLSLNVQLPRVLGGLRGGCIYLCTESAFPTSRLHEMSAGLCAKLKADLSSAHSWDAETRELVDELSVETLMENVHLTRAHDPQALFHTIHYYLPGFLDRQNGPTAVGKMPVRLIVLDSIGAIFRADLEPSKMMGNKESAGNAQNNTKFRMTERAAEMNQVADGLKVLADHYRLAVVVVNQVSDVFVDSASELTLSRPPILDRASGLYQNITHTEQPQASPNTPSSSLSLSTSAAPSSTTLVNSDPGTSSSTHFPCPIPLIYHHQARHFSGQKVTNNRKEAALGIHWTNAINARIMLNKLHASITPSALEKLIPAPHTHAPSSHLVKSTSVSIREAVIVFSPFGCTPLHLDRHSVQFVILSHGIVSIP
ncbi:hypothetical protein PCASD_06887 [Puccinia coronata f. sp. avenae]|uniref:RecA family profile 1 domain-containing protein n=1 Tax=Puccinia coronata f. sp. avenae TaxID=200324 RepID=A0A2N5TA84_9BASI|nr:hypothetical protein PCASD_11162 [Puccinia coronata f. sp. avenae]PLW42774.1 hypothetical protein PCASD_06887 [Puccinia coronata f. sp. avenae]